MNSTDWQRKRRSTQFCHRVILLFSRMRILSGLLITVLLLHAQCGGSCLLESFGGRTNTTPAPAAPACHQHTQVPSKGRQAPQENNTPCSQRSLIESSPITGKVILQFVAVLPAVIASFESRDAALHWVMFENAHVSPVSVPISVLRI